MPPRPANPFRQFVSHMVGHVSQGFVTDDAVTTHAVRIVGRIQEHLFGRWAAAQQTRLRCAVAFRDFRTGAIVGCSTPMSAACMVCGQPVCLDHAAVLVEQGDLCCFGCIELAKQARGAVPAEATTVEDEAERKLRQRYLRLLKLTGEPDEEEIRVAYKREAAKWHPDRHQGAAKKKKAEARFKEIGQARDYLISRAERRAA